MIGTVGAVLCFAAWVAWWMWSHMRPKAGVEIQEWQLKGRKRKRQRGGMDDAV